MAEAWMPGAERFGGGTSTRTPPGIGAPRAVWTVTGSDPGAWSAREEAQRLVNEEREAHLVWNPLTGDVVQTLAATCRGRLPLGGTRQHELYHDHGHEGRVCLVVAVVSPGETPFTDGPLRGLSQILTWLDSWGVERVWRADPVEPVAGTVDAGSPQKGSGEARTPGTAATGGAAAHAATAPHSAETARAARVARAWARGGHFGHDQVPGSCAKGPGRLDTARLLATGLVPPPSGPRAPSGPRTSATR
ncbi:hypothetical protein KGD83_22790 [Nocardiopsis akebiae]|uniref:Uncharacterized protein n=1 Tax=Nocardiopsis akebiae TaxID=2831968 RepID=A0ABX8C173_9ACTN|nr:hypothetical protein [Nocardiopsis akebiae]QUX28068.1 hypothetical protein KGD83_22790 [Nocardiopsis akebiae]